MILPSETYGKPVFHVLSESEFAACVEGTPYPTPVFHIKKMKTDTESIWRVTPDYSVKFTEDMLQRSDVLEYMVQAQQFIDTSNINTVVSTVTRLLNHWCVRFPRGVPDTAL